MKRFVALSSLLFFSAIAAVPAAASIYTIDQITNSPATFNVSNMTNTLLPPTTSVVTFRLNYTTLLSTGKITITPSTIAGVHNNFNPANIMVSCAELSGIGAFTGFSNVPLTTGSTNCASLPSLNTGINIIVQLTITLDDTALAPSPFSADTYTGSLTISGIDG